MWLTVRSSNPYRQNEKGIDMLGTLMVLSIMLGIIIVVGALCLIAAVINNWRIRSFGNRLLKEAQDESKRSSD